MKHDDLEQRARELFPTNETHRQRWLEAVRYLRSKGKYLNDPDTPPPEWASRVERSRA